MGGSGLTNTLSKGFKSFRKYSLGQQAQQKLIGQDAYDKLHFISTKTIKNADAAAAAEKQAKSDQALQQQILARQQEDLANLNDQENSRIKKMLVGGRYGTRGYRGSPLFRLAPGNSAGRGAGGGGGAAAGGGGGGTAASGGGAQANYGRIGGFLRGGNFTGGGRF
jgi:hypothetical protein